MIERQIYNRLYFKKWYKKNKEKKLQYNNEFRKSHLNYYSEYYKNRKLISGWKPKTDWKYLQKRCHKCGTQIEPLMKVGFYPQGNQMYRCRPCNTKKCQQYRIRGDNNIKLYINNVKCDKKFPLKYKARQLVFKALKTGIIIKPNKCETCKLKFDKIFAHHTDYLKPLEVTWLCRGCHANIHQNLHN